MQSNTQNFRLCALISGRGSNMLSLLNAIDDHRIAGEMSLVLSDCENAQGIISAQQRNIHTQIIPADSFTNPESFEAELIRQLDNIAPDLIVLAGFMRVLSPQFVAHFSHRIMNIHPSLLPKYKGLNTHQRVLKAQDKTHGCSVHFVTPELDGGPIIIQERVSVHTGDTAETLAMRVLEKEHLTYPIAVALFAEGRLKQKGNQCYLDEKVLDEPLDSSFTR